MTQNEVLNYLLTKFMNLISFYSSFTKTLIETCLRQVMDMRKKMINGATEKSTIFLYKTQMLTTKFKNF